MPIYEYKCKKCGKEYEVFQRMSEPSLTSCNFCKGSVKKLMSRSSFHLKGSGWYVTDYGGKKPPLSETSKADDATTPATDAVKTETTPPVASSAGSDE
jgi:putative FmdB family regulatory protein